MSKRRFALGTTLSVEFLRGLGNCWKPKTNATAMRGLAGLALRAAQSRWDWSTRPGEPHVLVCTYCTANPGQAPPTKLPICHAPCVGEPGKDRRGHVQRVVAARSSLCCSRLSLPWRTVRVWENRRAANARCGSVELRDSSLDSRLAHAQDRNANCLLSSERRQRQQQRPRRRARSCPPLRTLGAATA